METSQCQPAPSQCFPTWPHHTPHSEGRPLQRLALSFSHGNYVRRMLGEPPRFPAQNKQQVGPTVGRMRRLPFALRKNTGSLPTRNTNIENVWLQWCLRWLQVFWSWTELMLIFVEGQIAYTAADSAVVPHKARTSSSTSQGRTRCRRGCRHSRIWWNQLQLLSMALWMQALGDSTVVFHGQAA